MVGIAPSAEEVAVALEHLPPVYSGVGDYDLSAGAPRFDIALLSWSR